MKKRIIVVLVVVCMALFGSLAFAGEDWQDGFAKALDENNLAGALMLAYNSQASPQAVYEALEAFGVDLEEVEQSIMLAAEKGQCKKWCHMYRHRCQQQSPSGPQDPICKLLSKSCNCQSD